MVIGFAACPVCGSTTCVRLADGWQDEVDAGASLPIVGCGNPWHYTTLSLGDAPVQTDATGTPDAAEGGAGPVTSDE